MKNNSEIENSQVIIQKRIDEAISEEYENLLNKIDNDKLLQLIIKNEIHKYTIDEIKDLLVEEQ